MTPQVLVRRYHPILSPALHLRPQDCTHGVQPALWSSTPTRPTRGQGSTAWARSPLPQACWVQGPVCFTRLLCLRALAQCVHLAGGTHEAWKGKWLTYNKSFCALAAILVLLYSECFVFVFLSTLAVGQIPALLRDRLQAFFRSKSRDFSLGIPGWPMVANYFT